MSLSIAIAGAAGRMGRALIRAAAADARFSITGGTEHGESTNLNTDLGALGGMDALGITTVSDVAAAAKDAAIWIDFTRPAATLAALDALRNTNVRAAIIGTTGFNADEEKQIEAASQRMAIVRSGNFSLGVNLLAALVEQAAQRLGPEWDIELLEAHHRRKADSPSGTALLLAGAAAKGRGKPPDEVYLPPHHGIGGPRPEGGIGFATIRGGGIVGEHEVVFASEREVVRLSHQALDRAVFADGALAAALWAADMPAGLYSMRDVLNL